MFTDAQVERITVILTCFHPARMTFPTLPTTIGDSSATI